MFIDARGLPPPAAMPLTRAIILMLIIFHADTP